MRHLLSLFLPVILTLAACQGRSDRVDELVPVHSREQMPAGYMRAALIGDLSEFDFGGDSAFEAKFNARFFETPDQQAIVDNVTVNEIIRLYRDYWRETLLHPETRSELETQYGQKIAKLISVDFGPDNLDEIEAFIKDQGFHAITGRTPPLLELIIWRTNRRELVDVDITDRTVSVPIIFMEDFVSKGWAFYATFDRARAGGWTDETGIYCVTESYDMSSENFLISLLKHEARHFADGKLYPKLESADLEYRAKLTELAYADTSMSHLLNKFAHNAARVEQAPHPLAAWYVIHDLSALLLPEDMRGAGEEQQQARALAKLPTKDIQNAARELIEKHGYKLTATGAKTATGVILP